MKKANCFAFVRIEQSEPCGFATGETGEEVLNERSEFRNLTLDSGHWLSIEKRDIARCLFLFSAVFTFSSVQQVSGGSVRGHVSFSGLPGF